MFTGIIQETGTVKAIRDLDGGKEITVECGFAGNVRVDQSININGTCHTVIDHTNQVFTVQSIEETLRKTNIGMLAQGDPVNLERSLRPDQLLDGHLVQGHVDATGVVKIIQQEGTDWLFTIEYPPPFNDLVVDRGSIAVDGISLTVASETDHHFTVAIIPYTYEHTNLCNKEQGSLVNLEFDVLGKYVVRYMKNRERGER